MKSFRDLTQTGTVVYSTDSPDLYGDFHDEHILPRPVAHKGGSSPVRPTRNKNDLGVSTITVHGTPRARRYITGLQTYAQKPPKRCMG